MLRIGLRRDRSPLLRRLLDPSPRTLFAVAAIAFAAALWYAQPHARFLVRGSLGEAEVLAAAPAGAGAEHARYRVLLRRDGAPPVEGAVESGRHALEPGRTIPVLYRRDNPRDMRAVEAFAPWTRPIWLSIVGLAALGLGLRERDRAASRPPPAPGTPPREGPAA